LFPHLALIDYSVTALGPLWDQGFVLLHKQKAPCVLNCNKFGSVLGYGLINIANDHKQQ
jgi:hypothetical protein